LLEDHIKEAIDCEDIDSLNNYSRIFTDLADTEIEDIISFGDSKILGLLLKILDIEEVDYIDQVDFWKHFCSKISEI
jgi:transposase